MGTALVQILKRHAFGPLLVFACHVFSYGVFDAYEAVPWLDIPMHLAGGVAIAAFIWGSLNVLEGQDLLQPSSGNLRRLLVFALTVTAAVFWEFGELAFDLIVRGALERTLPDTLADLAMGLAGGSLYLAMRFFLQPEMKKAATRVAPSSTPRG
jgi:hypothetical protein